MTKNQIEYAKLLETRRANVANEALTRTRDLNAHTVAMGTLSETQRHNRASERISLDVNSESRRHNLAVENLQASSLQETVRANLAREQETSRANLAREAETMRANLAKEQETRRHNTLSHQISLRGLEEQTRSNLARENETSRHNLVQEAEDQRSARAAEAIKLLQLEESERASREHENTVRRGQDVQASVQRSGQAIQREYNAQSIALGRYQTDVRDAREAVSQREVLRHNLASEGEVRRSNQARENVSLIQARAARQQADVAKSKATSEKVRNYSMAISDTASQIIRLLPIGGIK